MPSMTLLICWEWHQDTATFRLPRRLNTYVIQYNRASTRNSTRPSHQQRLRIQDTPLKQLRVIRNQARSANRFKAIDDINTARKMETITPAVPLGHAPTSICPDEAHILFKPPTQIPNQPRAEGESAGAPHNCTKEIETACNMERELLASSSLPHARGNPEPTYRGKQPAPARTTQPGRKGKGKRGGKPGGRFYGATVRWALEDPRRPILLVWPDP